MTLTSSPSHRPLARPLYRIRQGVTGLLAMFQAVDDVLARAFLADEAYALYARMSTADRAHSLRVLARLRAAGQDDPDLLAAALLHDNGKSEARLAVWQRTLKVLLARLAPERWRTLSRPAQPGSWRYPFYILAAHPTLGAANAAEAGCSPATVWLIRHHEDGADPGDPRFPLLRALQEADAIS